MTYLLISGAVIILVVVGLAAIVYTVEGRRRSPDLERAMWTIVALAAPVLGFIVWLLFRGLPGREHRTRISPR